MIYFTFNTELNTTSLDYADNTVKEVRHFYSKTLSKWQQKITVKLGKLP